LGILSGALIAAGLSELGFTVYVIDIAFAVMLLLVVLIPLPFYIRHDAEIRLELHREDVKDHVERERRRYLNNMRNGSRTHSSSSSKSSYADDNAEDHVINNETNASNGAGMEDSEGALPSDNERDCFIVDKEKRPLLRSRYTSGNSSKNYLNNIYNLITSSNNSTISHDGDQVYGTVSHQNIEDKKAPLRDEWTYFLLNLIMVCTGLGSGVAISWSQVYFLQEWSTSETVATLGYVGFQLGAATSRFSSDYLFAHMSRKRLIIYGCIGASLGTFTSALSCLSRTGTTLAFAVAGFILAGFFFGPIYPAILSFATTLRGYPTGEAVPVVKASTLIAGMVIAPLFFGNVIDVIGYMSSFLIQAAVYLLGFVCAWFLHSDRHHACNRFRVEESRISSLLTDELTLNNSNDNDVIVTTSDTPVAADVAT
jgi:hypothetical protein